MKKNFWMTLAWLLPKKIVYFATIRVWAYATTGKYGDTEAPAITMSDAIKRWEDA